ncbi:MAG: polysaccharide deacetylase [Butyrivibrio sp.]|nr:polysaccharide deacetylase [Butyrivibrio sp.]
MASGKDRIKSKKVYSKRITYLRRIILIVVAAAIIIPTVVCLLLAVRYDRLRVSYEQTEANLEWYRNKYGTEMEILSGSGKSTGLASSNATDTGEETVEKDTDSNAESDTEEFDVDYATVEVSGAQNPEDIEGTRYVYLTFDDGPSSSTDDILDILDRYGVKATFFVCGKPDAKYTELYQRIVEDGHTLGMHSYSHKYNVIYQSLESFRTDMDKLRIFLYETTGVWPKFYRFPGGSSNKVSKVDMTELCSYLDDSGITFFDWNVSAGDDRGANKNEIYSNIVNNIPKFKHCIVLMHDAADKKSTVEALPEIIEAIQAMDDTVIVPITDDTLPVQHIKY